MGPFSVTFMVSGIKCGREVFDKTSCGNDEDGRCGESGLRCWSCQGFIGKVFDQAEDFSGCRIEVAWKVLRDGTSNTPRGSVKIFGMMSVLRMRSFLSEDNEHWLKAFVRVRSSDRSRPLCVLVSRVNAISMPRSFADALGGGK